VFFSTSNAGGKAPAMAKNETTLQDAFNIDALKRCDIIITCPRRRLHHRGVPQAARRRLELATGLTPPPRCAWKKTRSSFWTRSTCR
jgi:hypothetical protein